jgi:hypothetical protein
LLCLARDDAAGARVEEDEADADDDVPVTVEEEDADEEAEDDDCWEPASVLVTTSYLQLGAFES